MVLFNVNNSKGNTVRSKQEAEKTICSLTTTQRPTLVFFPGPEQISMEVVGADLLAVKMEFDKFGRISSCR